MSNARLPKQTVIKIINGKEVSNTDFRKETIKALLKYPDGARVDDLVNEFGETWNNAVGRADLARHLNNMKNADVVQTVARGVYKPTKLATHAEGGVNRFDQAENMILSVIRDQGGVATKKQIVEALKAYDMETCRYQGRDYTGSEEQEAAKKEYIGHCRKIEATINKSIRIRQDTNRWGVYNLPYEELVRIPVLGRSAAWLIKAAASDFADVEKDDKWECIRAAHYKNVGHMLDMVMQTADYDSSELVSEPSLADCFDIYWYTATQTVGFIKEEWCAEYEKELAEKGVPKMEHQYLAEKEWNAQDIKIKQRFLLDEFLKGTSLAIIEALPNFYEDIGAFFNIDAAGLSYGLILPKVLPGERLRKGKFQPSQYDVNAQRVQNEIELENQAQESEERRQWLREQDNK